MLIRPICKEELNAFVNFSNQPQKNSEFLAYLAQMWNAGYVKPEWCFVAEEAEKFVGRISYWTLPSQNNYFEVDFLEVPWDANYLEVGTQLLQESLALLNLLPHTIILYSLDTPYPEPKPDESTAKRIDLLEQCGFSLTRETCRFELQLPSKNIKTSERLSYRSLDDVGEDVFINAVMLVSSKSLDRAIQEEVNEQGELHYARKCFETMKAFKYKQNWWQLAYNENGALVGLVIPAENDGGAIIAYIGVVPEYRGQGYVNDLLAQGTFTLMADGASRVRADADINNTPMLSAFESAGYKQFALRREYRKH